VVVAIVVALALGAAGGWWFSGRDKGTGASPTPSTSCATTPAASSSAKPVKYPATRTITVNVYNATTRKGLAKATSLELAARGFVIGKVANDPLSKVIAASAEIRSGPAGATKAKVVGAQVPGPVYVIDARKDTSVDFVLGEGYSALNTPAQANAQLNAAPSASASSSCRPTTSPSASHSGS
jgi:hypothetical protein